MQALLQVHHATTGTPIESILGIRYTMRTTGTPGLQSYTAQVRLGSDMFTGAVNYHAAVASDRTRGSEREDTHNLTFGHVHYRRTHDEVCCLCTLTFESSKHSIRCQKAESVLSHLAAT